MAGRDPILYAAQASPTDVGLRSTARVASFTSQFIRPQTLITGVLNESTSGVRVALPRFTPGALVLVFIDGVPTVASLPATIKVSWPTDWFELVPVTQPPSGSATMGNGTVGWHIWTGNEPATLDLTFDILGIQVNFLNSATIDIVEIVDWHGSQPPEAGLPTEQNTGTGTQPNPPPVTASWGAEPGNLFLAVAFRGNATKSITAWPANYTTDQHDARADQTSIYGGQSIASRVFFSETDDPAAFTVSGGGTSHVSVTIVIRGNIPNTDITRAGSVEEEEASAVDVFAGDPEQWEFTAGPIDDAGVVVNVDEYALASFYDDEVLSADFLAVICDDPGNFESACAGIDDAPDVDIISPSIVDDEIVWVFSNEDWSPEWSQGPPDQVDDIPFAPALDDVFTPAEVLGDPLEYESVAGPLAFPDDETGETTGGALFEELFAPALWLDLAEDAEFTAGPPDQNDDYLAGVFDDDAIASAFIPPEGEEWLQRATDEDDPNFAVPFPASIDDVYDLPDWGDEWSAAGVDQDDEITSTAFDDDALAAAYIPEPAEEWSQVGTPEDDPNFAVAFGAASFDDDTIAAAFVPPEGEEWTQSGTPEDDPNFAAPFLADATDDTIESPAWLFEDTEWTSTPLDDAPVIVDLTIIAPAADDDDLAAAFIPPAGEEWTQSGTPEDDPNFAAPFGAIAVDDVFDLPEWGDEWTSTPADQNDDVAIAASTDDVFELPEPAEEWTAAGIDQSDDNTSPASADDVFDLPEWGEEHAATPVEDTPLETWFATVDDVFPLPEPAEEWSGTPADQNDDAPIAAAVDDVFDLPPHGEEWTAGPADTTPEDFPPIAGSFDDDTLDWSLAIADPEAREYTQAPPDAPPLDTAILATAFDDEDVGAAIALILSIEPGEWSTPPDRPAGATDLDGFRIFSRPPRAVFYGPDRVTEFVGSIVEVEWFGPDRVTEFMGPQRRREFIASLYLT